MCMLKLVIQDHRQEWYVSYSFFSLQGIHCILDISVATIEKLHKQQIYPIVLFIKFKSFKQIKEVKDTRHAEKVSAKAAKEMYEHGLKVENEYRNYISGT